MDILCSPVTEVVSKIGELLVEQIAEQCEHLLHPNKSFNSLREDHEKLNDMKQALQGRVNADRTNGLIIAPAVEKWLREVEGFETELRRLYDDEANENNQWCRGCRRYSLSKRAAKKRAIVVSLKDEGEKFSILSYAAPPPRAGEIFTASIKGFQSRTKIIMEVIEKLKNDEFKRISICGMGGVGKTTMVKEVIKKVEAGKLFDKVAFAVVSQNVDYRRVQGDIAGMLDLTLKKETLQGRASEILDKLKNISKVMIVLDDVWTELDFEQIGLPANIEYHGGCKILFTSRNEHVCRIMGSQKECTIPVLSGDEAWELFKEMAGSDICNKPDINPIAKEVANECGGLPIAIVTIGKTPLNEKKHTWMDLLNQLKKSSVASSSEMQDSAYSRIQLSYNFLDSEEHKDCLLLCCLFPEDYNIPIEVVMRHGLGLGLFKGVGDLLAVRNRVHKLVDELKSRFLLLDGEKEECVKMHDIVRDTIIRIASGGHQYTVQGGVEIERPKGGACDYKAISLVLDKSNKLPIGLDCSNYQILQVESKEEETIHWLENSFQGMSKVKVLSLKKLYIPKSPSLFKALHNLWTLRLEYCEVEDISIIGTELTKLEILSFAFSNIKQLPLEIGQLGSLRLLDLSGCSDLYKIHSNVLASLSRLEELYIGDKNFSWQQNKAALIELKLLSHQLRVVEIRVKKIEILPKDLAFENLEKFWVYVGGQSYSYYKVFSDEYRRSNVLKIEEVDFNSINCSLLMKQLVKNCEILHLVAVRYLKNLNTIQDIDEENFPNLEDLCVKSCHDLDFLFAKKSVVEFSKLVNLRLIDLPNLIGFAEVMVSDETDQSIPSVEELRGSEIVEDEQHSFSGKLFTCDWMQRFPKLEKIFLTGCSSLNMVFDLQEYPELVSLAAALLFPQMKEMRINRLSKLRYLWGNVPHNVQGFENLRSIQINGCDCLRYVFTPSIVRALKQLEKLGISRCQLMEELVLIEIENNGDDDDEKEKAETIVFAKLVSLDLHDLSRLVSFCSNSDFEVVWPSLRQLSIQSCDKLNLIQIQKVIESAKQDNPVVTSNIDCGFLNCCFGYANKSNIKSSSPKDLVPSVNEMEISLCSPMPILQHIRIRQCNSVDAIFSHSKRMNDNSFSGVESLELYDVPNLVSFCHRTWDSPSLDNNNVVMDAFNEDGTRKRRVPFIHDFLFPNLTSLKMRKCHKINSLFSPSSSTSVQRLKELVIRDCNNIEEIVLGEKETQPNKIVFSGLRLLILQSLQNFRSFCSSSHHLEFPSLEEVSINDCLKMEELSCRSLNTPKLQDVTIIGEAYEIKYMPKSDLNAIIRQYRALNVALQTSETLRWSEPDQGVLSCLIKNHDKLLRVISDVVTFTNLRTLRISRCHNLTSVLPFSVAQNLVQLEHLSVQKCNVIEEIVIHNDEEIEGVNKKVKIIFPELRELDLRHLPNLKCFCSAAYDFELPSCHEMVIEECPNMTIFSHGTARTPKLPQIFLKVEEYGEPRMPTRTIGDLNSTIHYIHNAGVFEEEMQKTETFARIDHGTHLLGYITRVPELDLVGCELLLNCVPSNMMHIFQHLEQLAVKECVSMIEIFESEGVCANNEKGTIMSYELEVMNLHSLPKLASIWKSHHGSILGFENLVMLKVMSCHSLKSVFPLSITKSLPKLGLLEVSNCQIMEEIVAFTKDEGDKISQEPNEAKVIIFPELWKLVLKDLPSLRCFCPSPCDLLLPKCQSTVIENCAMMEFFCHGITFTPRLHYLSVEDTEFDSEEGLDAIIQPQNQIQNLNLNQDAMSVSK